MSTVVHLTRVALAAVFMILTNLSLSNAQVAASWDQLVARAKEEGHVNLYGPAIIPQAERLIAAFNKAYPDIQVRHTPGAVDLPPRILAERSANRDGADVFISPDPLWFKANEADLLDLNTPNSRAYPSNAWQIRGKAAIVAIVPFGLLVWNTNYVPQGLETYQDLLRPDLQGRVGFRDGMSATLAGFLDFLERRVGREFLTDLGNTHPQFYASTAPMSQAVASGEIWAAPVGAVGTLLSLRDQGAPVAWAVPKHLGFANPWVAAVMSTSRRPNAAILFVDFLLSPTGQAALNGNESASPRADVVGEVNLEDYENLRAENFPQDIIAAWGQKFNQYFHR